MDSDTIRGYENVTREFLDVIKRQTHAQITKQDLKTWIAQQHADGYHHNSICNLYINVVCFLHFCVVDHKKFCRSRSGLPRLRKLPKHTRNRR